MAGRVKPIPVPVILAAVNGDEDALAAVVAHYQSYIRALATRPLKDDYGNTYSDESCLCAPAHVRPAEGWTAGQREGTSPTCSGS